MQTPTQPAGAPVPAMNGIAPLILIIEDNAPNLLLAQTVLRRAGFRIVTATTAEEGRLRLTEQVPDLVLTDIQLPGMDGIELVRLLHSEPATASIPVVALSAHAMKEEEEKAMAAGCLGFIRKPIDTRGLAGQISAFLTVQNS